ncbi:MAG: DEAD/DEAH box helicase [Bacteroidota bacterium]
MQKTNVFDHFRRQSGQVKSKVQRVETVYFQIMFDDFGAYLQTVDEKANVVEVSYLNYSGAERQVLRLLEQIQERNSFLIDWERPEDQIYLAEHDFLLEALKACDNVIDDNRELLTFEQEVASVKLVLKTDTSQEGKTKLINSNVVTEIKGTQIDSFQIINESYLLAGNKVIEVESLGGNFASLSYFNTVLSEEELPIFLSLFFSNIEQVNRLVYEDYRLAFSEDPIKASPCLVFEKIDTDESLLMRVGQVLPDVSVELLDQFELYRFAEINDLERVVTIKTIEREPVELHVQEIEKLLKKQTPRRRNKKERLEILKEGDLFVVPKEVAANFIYNELPELILRYQLFGAEKLKSYKISTVSPGISLKLEHGIDFFEGDVQLDFGGETMNLFDVLNQFNKNRYVQLSDGTHAIVNEKYIRRLERIFNKKDRGKTAQISFFDMPLVEELIDEKVQGDVFKKPRQFYSGLNEVKEQTVKLPEVKATLRPYQEEGYKWLKYLYDFQLGGCLADDMGLGKTLQTISLLANTYAEGETKPSLIIMPRSLLYNWEREVEKFAPQLSTYVFHGNERDFEKAMSVNLILTTYAIARNEIERLKEEEFFYIILDESQNIKNVNALTTKAIMLLKSDHRLALSGTPVENNLGELYSLFRFLNPTMFGTLNNFGKNYLTPIQKYGDKSAMQHLRKKIYPFILRRLKKDVLKDLPDKIEQTLYVEMSDQQQKLYEQRRQFYQVAINSQIAEKGVQGSQFFIFQALNELRQIASVPENLSDGKIPSPKRELLQEQLLDTVANGHKALVFANYLSAVELISEAVESAGIGYVSMTGATRNRQKLVDRFQNDPDCRVFIMTLKTGGTGLNLTAADTIFIFDPWWNVAAENQAIDRAHRIGQKNTVLAYKLITQGTIEEKILKLQEVKKELFDSIITTDGSATKSLTEEDINFILGAT